MVLPCGLDWQGDLFLLLVEADFAFDEQTRLFRGGKAEMRRVAAKIPACVAAAYSLDVYWRHLQILPRCWLAHIKCWTCIAKVLVFTNKGEI
jgi:hypothetical protein